MSKELCIALGENDASKALALLDDAEIQRNINELFQGTVFHFTGVRHTCLFWACGMENIRVVKKILTVKDVDVNKQNERNSTALHSTARRGNAEIAKVLIMYGAKIITNKNGSTPIHLAAQHGHVEVLRLLLEHDISWINHRDCESWTALHLAVSSNNLECVKSLVKYGANTTIKDTSDQTALDVALKYGRDDVVDFLRKGSEEGAKSTKVVSFHPQLPRRQQSLPFQIEHGLVASVEKMAVKSALQFQSLEERVDKVEKLSNIHTSEICHLKEKRELGACASLTYDHHINTSSAETMKAEVRKNFLFFKENIIASDHIDFLYQSGALELNEVQNLRAIGGEIKKTEELLYTLMGKPNPNTWIHAFVNSLSRIPNTKHLTSLFR